MSPELSESDLYVWLLAHMGAVETEAKRYCDRNVWDPPLLAHLHQFIKTSAQRESPSWFVRQRNLLEPQINLNQ